MMKRSYKIVGIDDLPESLLKEYGMEDPNRRCWNTVCALVEYVDGVPKTVWGWDGGEPEDQILYRDWSWVETAMNAAYKTGHKDAMRPLFESQAEYDARTKK